MHLPFKRRSATVRNDVKDSGIHATFDRRQRRRRPTVRSFEFPIAMKSSAMVLNFSAFALFLSIAALPGKDDGSSIYLSGAGTVREIFDRRPKPPATNVYNCKYQVLMGQEVGSNVSGNLWRQRWRNELRLWVGRRFPRCGFMFVLNL